MENQTNKLPKEERKQLKIQEIINDPDKPKLIDDTELFVFPTLREHWRVFVENYVLLRDAAKAYKLAFPLSVANNKAAQHSAYNLLKKAPIIAAIKEIKELNKFRYNLDKDFFVHELMEIVLDKMINADVRRKALKDLADITGNNEFKHQDKQPRITFILPQQLPPQTEDTIIDITPIVDAQKIISKDFEDSSRDTITE